jgi:hypothetical protein
MDRWLAVVADAYATSSFPPPFTINKIRIDVTLRGIDYEGQFSQFPGELYMLCLC